MRRTVVIDFLPESVSRYSAGWTIVAIDVIRATSTAVTAVAAGRRCFPAPTVEAALAVARRFPDPLLAGESNGTTPVAFEMDNSPAQLASRTDVHRPLVLVSSSGTKVIHHAAEVSSDVYLACFRCYSAIAEHLARHHPRVALIGAGSKGEFREEDQMCCAWIAGELISRGYTAGSPLTAEVAGRWRGSPPDACLCSRSVDFLKRTGQLRDLEFILAHIDDLDQVFEVRAGEVTVSREAVGAA